MRSRASTSRASRPRSLSALGATHDPALGERARNYGLTPAVAVGELPYLYLSHVAEPENVGPFWLWLQANFDALAARLPDQYQSFPVRFAAVGRCSASQADELRTWLTPRAGKLIGGERTLAQWLEAITQCAALRDHFGEQSLSAWAQAHAES